MNSEQVAAIERLRELEKKATHGQWFTDPEFEESLTAMVKSNECEDLIFGACDWPDADLICALRNDGMPLIEALQQSLSEAQADARVFSGSYSALAEDFGRMKEENERLRKKEAKLKETLLPVCEYAAEIYNRGIPAIQMPDDTIQRLNFAFKMFGG